MMEKITKKNSIIFNQLWINKIIEEGNMKLLPHIKPGTLSIGEYLEQQYQNIEDQEQIKINKNNSILFQIEWIRKYNEEGLEIPRKKLTNKYSLGEILELKYFEKEIFIKSREQEKIKCIQLNSKNKL